MNQHQGERAVFRRVQAKSSQGRPTAQCDLATQAGSSRSDLRIATVRGACRSIAISFLFLGLFFESIPLAAQQEKARLPLNPRGPLLSAGESVALRWERQLDQKVGSLELKSRQTFDLRVTARALAKEAATSGERVLRLRIERAAVLFEVGGGRLRVACDTASDKSKPKAPLPRAQTLIDEAYRAQGRSLSLRFDRTGRILSCSGGRGLFGAKTEADALRVWSTWFPQLPKRELAVDETWTAADEFAIQDSRLKIQSASRIASIKEFEFDFRSAMTSKITGPTSGAESDSGPTEGSTSKSREAARSGSTAKPGTPGATTSRQSGTAGKITNYSGVLIVSVDRRDGIPRKGTLSETFDLKVQTPAREMKLAMEMKTLLARIDLKELPAKKMLKGKDENPGSVGTEEKSSKRKGASRSPTTKPSSRS